MQRRPPGSLLVALAAAASAALLAAVVHGAVRVAQGKAPDFTTGLEQAFDWPNHASLEVAILGAVLGFALFGVVLRVQLAMTLLRVVRRALALGLGMALGAALGTAAYVALWMRGSPDGTWQDALRSAAAGFGAPGDAFTLCIAAGALAGLVGAVHAGGRKLVRQWGRIAAGGLVGALAGLMIYAVAYVLMVHPGRPQDASYLMHFAEAVWSFTIAEFLLVAIAALSGAMLSRYSWRLYGIVTFVSLLFVVLGYITYTLTRTLPGVPADERGLSVLLFCAELLSLGMVLLYSFYTIDVAARKHWRRSTEVARFSPYYLPKVAIHVPTFNEPPELVEATLRTLLALDYPSDRVVIMVGDDSTRPECAGPLRDFCLRNGILYRSRGDRTGYKAGALNDLLARTPIDTNLIAVIDADYQVEPNYLRETVGYFADQDLGWLQTPQDYRNRHQSFLTEQYYVADAYFYRTILPSRNEENSIIFCGTMGMLRVRALREVGGWNEKCITEDAELSVRLLNAGWRSLYVNKTYGRGLIPVTFEAFKKQHYRWAFGGGRIFRSHVLRLLFGRFTFRQRLDYLVGTLNWFEGAFICAIAAFVLTLGLADLFGNDIITHHDTEIALVGLVPVFLLIDGLTRVHLVLRRAVHLSFGGTLRILGMWFSVKFSNMRAALKGALGFQIPFVRTSKKDVEGIGRLAALAQAVRITPFESTLALLLGATALAQGVRIAFGDATGGELAGRGFLTFWLAYYTLVFTAAPLYAYKSLVLTRDARQATQPQTPQPQLPPAPPPQPEPPQPATTNVPPLNATLSPSQP